MNRFVVQAPTDVASARRGVVAVAARLGYGETEAGQVAIVVTELAQNLLRHGQGGEMLAAGDGQHPRGIEIMALDRGPGMRNVADCMRDGYSTGGTSGNGLGAVKRLTREMLVHSRPGAGTAILVRMGGDAVAAPRATAALCVPKPGEEVCGDTAAIVAPPDGSVGLLLADGLGHGPLAAAASREAARLFRDRPASGPGEILAVLHAGLRSTRGAALATARIDTAARRITYGGIGNIAAFIADSGGVRRMVSHSGTAGHTAGRMQTFQYPYYERPVVVMFSDGLTTSWSPDSHPGLFSEDPSLIAGVLYRDHVRGRDDASVVVWKG
jgi:anti-sigma regulatory factor (Ser/Thr protein kinase)